MLLALTGILWAAILLTFGVGGYWGAIAWALGAVVGGSRRATDRRAWAQQILTTALIPGYLGATVQLAIAGS